MRVGPIQAESRGHECYPHKSADEGYALQASVTVATGWRPIRARKRLTTSSPVPDSTGLGLADRAVMDAQPAHACVCELAKIMSPGRVTPEAIVDHRHSQDGNAVAQRLAQRAVSVGVGDARGQLSDGVEGNWRNGHRGGPLPILGRIDGTMLGAYWLPSSRSQNSGVYPAGSGRRHDSLHLPSRSHQLGGDLGCSRRQRGAAHNQRAQAGHELIPAGQPARQADLELLSADESPGRASPGQSPGRSRYAGSPAVRSVRPQADAGSPRRPVCR